MLTPLRIDLGSVSFELPALTRDATTYEFSRPSEQILIAPAFLSPGTPLRDLVTNRLRQIEMGARALDRSARVASRVSETDGQGRAIVVGEASTAFSATTVRYAVAAFRATGGDVHTLTATSARHNGLDFDDLISTLSFDNRSVLPKPGWLTRRLGNTSIAVPDDFSVPLKLEYHGDGWTMLLTKGDYRLRPWKEPFRRGDEVHVVRVDPLSFPPESPLNWKMSVERQMSVVPAIVEPDGRITSDAAYSCTVREALVAREKSELHLYAASNGLTDSFKEAWALLVSTLRFPPTGNAPWT